jgi:hypothetical protein
MPSIVCQESPGVTLYSKQIITCTSVYQTLLYLALSPSVIYYYFILPFYSSIHFAKLGFVFYFFFLIFFSRNRNWAGSFLPFCIMDGMVNGTAAAAVVAKPVCGSGTDSNPEDYDLPLHIAAVCKKYWI